MDVVGVLVAGLLGGAVGWMAAPVADAIAQRRYAAGAPGHDPEDAEVAPLGAPTSARARRTVAVVGALAFAAVAASGAPLEVVGVLCVTAAPLGVACIIDLQYLRLPDVLTYGTAAGSAVLLVAASASLDALGSLRGAAVSALAFSGLLFVAGEVFRLVRGQSGMGLGDVKLALPLGATAGWVGYDRVLGAIGSVQVTVGVLLLSNVLGIVGGLALTRRRPGSVFPFGPFLVLGWLGVVSIAA